MMQATNNSGQSFCSQLVAVVLYLSLEEQYVRGYYRKRVSIYDSGYVRSLFKR